MGTDEEWEKWGQQDPYFGVITQEKFRSRNLTEDAKAEFFDSGRHHVGLVLSLCKKHLDPDFSPGRVLDFGCGTGRLVVPFAEVAEQVVGLDVSDSMLREARKNCDENSVHNVELLRSDDDLNSLQGSFDLIHSVIVFQHIPIGRGRSIFKRLLSHLATGGIGVLQVTYARSYFSETYGAPPVPLPPPEVGSIVKLRRKILRRLKGLVRATVPPVQELSVNGSPGQDPEMQMNQYNLNDLFFLIQSEGIRNIFLDFTDHGGELGAFLYFQKPGSE